MARSRILILVFAGLMVALGGGALAHRHAVRAALPTVVHVQAPPDLSAQSPAVTVAETVQTSTSLPVPKSALTDLKAAMLEATLKTAPSLQELYPNYYNCAPVGDQAVFYFSKFVPGGALIEIQSRFPVSMRTQVQTRVYPYTRSQIEDAVVKISDAGAAGAVYNLETDTMWLLFNNDTPTAKAEAVAKSLGFDYIVIHGTSQA